MSSMRNVVILGGGISGLTCAWSLARGSPRLNITLLEGSGRTGGWIQSDRLAHGGGVHELGPRSMRTAHTAGKLSLAMLQELGLESQIIPICRGHKAAQRRLIHTDQFDLVEIPSNVSWLYKRKPPFTRPLLPSLAKEPFIGPIKDQNDESVHDFISRRFGNEIAKWLIDPMCRGIYAGSSKELSIKSCFPLLYNYESNHGSILKGIMFESPSKSGVDDNELVAKAKKDKWMLYTLKDGLQTLTDTLTDAAISIGVDICTDTSAIGIEFENDEQIKITTDDGSEYMADYLISTIPAKSLADILPAGQSNLSDLLARIPAVDVAVANLEYDGQVIPSQWRQAFGYLVPSHQSSKILGTVFDSSTFPELDREDKLSTRLTVMMGGQWFNDMFGHPDTTSVDLLTDVALKSLRQHLHITDDPADCNITIHKSCIPQYQIGHQRILDEIAECVKGLPLSLLGSSYGGVSVNDCIMNSLNETNKILSSSSFEQ